MNQGQMKLQHLYDPYSPDETLSVCPTPAIGGNAGDNTANGC